MTTIQTLYASGGACPIHTLQIINTALPDGFLAFVQGFDDLTATTEAAQVITFAASGIGISLPERNGKALQDLQFQLDNVSGEALGHIRAIIEAGTPTTVIYRVYHPDDLSAPAEPPLILTGTGCKVTPTAAGFRASFHDLLNKSWPRRRHTPETTPGLRYST